jgi:hypothetical protein
MIAVEWGAATTPGRHVARSASLPLQREDCRFALDRKVVAQTPNQETPA